MDRCKGAPQAHPRTPAFRRRGDADGKAALGGAGAGQRVAASQFRLGGMGRGAASRRSLAQVRRAGGGARRAVGQERHSGPGNGLEHLIGMRPTHRMRPSSSGARNPPSVPASPQVPPWRRRNSAETRLLKKIEISRDEDHCCAAASSLRTSLRPTKGRVCPRCRSYAARLPAVPSQGVTPASPPVE
jgi:hypothetical protein